ncbi:hypothetical protein [Pengzhenrongella sp.]|jgi:leader peptidase (prepilin peptidase)/N-methyltransferase|uniref:hypothetical protein n=1 Tax=Pengzhenrongella sp. TaxID=2888820 RepID=UPI002F943742
MPSSDSWGVLIIGGLAAFLLGAVFAVGILLTGRAVRGSRIPFGPWMLLGAAIGIAAGDPFWLFVWFTS